MQPTIVKNHYLESLLGKSRDDCVNNLSNQGIGSIAFAHWLAIPSQQLLLVFRHQQCVAIDGYQVAA